MPAHAAADVCKVNLQVFTANRAAQAFWRELGYGQDDVLAFGKRL